MYWWKDNRPLKAMFFIYSGYRNTSGDIYRVCACAHIRPCVPVRACTRVRVRVRVRER